MPTSSTSSPTPDVRNGRKAKHPSTTSPSLPESLQRFWQKSHAGDYLALILLTTALLLLKLHDEPFHQLFLLTDTRLQHPHADPERIDIFSLLLYAGAAPAIILLLWTLLWKPDIHKAHTTLLGLTTAVLTTVFVTDILKDAIGRPRPDLLARCKPAPSAPTDAWVTVDVCTEKDHHLLHDGWRSFPSGHSSFAFAGLGWLALFFASQLRVFRPRASLLPVLLCLVPLLAAALIAISRLEDYRHDVGDVLAGSALGALITGVNWRRYYPSVFGKGCEEPYPATSAGGRNGFQRIWDEEEGDIGEREDSGR